MRLKQDILDVLEKHGVEQAQIDQLVGFFTDKASEAEGRVASLIENIASLQKQLEEETARAEGTRDGILKFVNPASEPEANGGTT